MGVDSWTAAESGTDAEPWKADDTAGSLGEWHDGGDEAPFTGEFAQENVSKHAEERRCFNCDLPGHSKAECTNPAVERPFDGSCRVCEQPGHRGIDCPLQKCKICNGEGHKSSACTVNRVFLDLAGLGIKDLPMEQAWELLEKADKERDVDEIKMYILSYAKAYPAITLPELEAVFRDNKMNTYLIATEKAISKTHSIVNLQGKAEQKYVVSVQFSAKPRRAKMAEAWPESPEQNLERLAEAGFPLDGKVVVCDSCKEVGHVRKSCPNGGDGEEKPKIAMCCHCMSESHRARDCNNRPKRGGGIVCHNCGENHKASDCTKCSNCLAEDHKRAECPLPIDWSRVKCKNCGEKGHGAKRCPQPPAEAANDENTAPAGDDGGDWGEGAGEGDGHGQAESWGSGGQAENWESGAAVASANSGW